MRLRFVAFGVPQSQGSVQSFGYQPKGRDGRPMVRQTAKGAVVPVIRTKTMSDNPKNKGWRQLVAEAASVAIEVSLIEAEPFALLRGAVTLTCAFYLPRPRYIRNKVVPHTTRPDADKLTRSVKDALTGVAWVDDGQVNKLLVTKQYAEPQGGVPRAEITVEASDPLELLAGGA